MLLLASAAGSPAFAQIDLQGEWAGIFHEDLPQRGGMRLGDYTGLPLNEAGIRKAMAWDEAARSTRERQCIPHVATYARRGPATIRLTKVTDIDSGRLIAYSPRRQLWTSANDLDGRPRASLGSRPVDADGLYVVSGLSRTLQSSQHPSATAEDS